MMRMRKYNSCSTFDETLELLYYTIGRYDMRKALTMDVEKKSVVPLPAPVSMMSMMMLTWIWMFLMTWLWTWLLT